MSPEVFYLTKIAPALLALALGSFVVGWLISAVIWAGGKRKARRIKADCDRIHREMRAARRRVQ